MSEQDHASCQLPELLTIGVVLAAASVSPLILTVAAAGYASMTTLTLSALLPTIGVIALSLLLAFAIGWQQFRQDVLTGLGVGALGTVGLEIIRIIGFRIFHSMPGSLPMLMGVLITNRFMQGPDLLSNVLGWAYHFWNGASFGVVYLLFLGRRRWWWGVGFGLVVGVIFMASPVVVMTGAGPFGSAIGPGFATTVLLAHTAFGGIMGWLTSRRGEEQPLSWRCLKACLPDVIREVPR